MGVFVNCPEDFLGCNLTRDDLEGFDDVDEWVKGKPAGAGFTSLEGVGVLFVVRRMQRAIFINYVIGSSQYLYFENRSSKVRNDDSRIDRRLRF